MPLPKRGKIFEVVEIDPEGNKEGDVIDFLYNLKKNKNNIKIINIEKYRKNLVIYYFKNFENSITKKFIENETFIGDLVIKNGLEHWILYYIDFENNSAIENLIENLKRNSNLKIEDYNYEIIGVEDLKNILNISPELTPTEKKVLYYAYVNGYFEYPKAIRLDELAEKIGVSKATIDKYIRNAVKKLLNKYFNNLNKV
jgi:predicted DNA binding protein